MSSSAENPVLLVLFSGRGEPDHHVGLTESGSNTELLASRVAEQIACDVFRIEAAEPYPADLDEAKNRNFAEQAKNARPAIANALPDVSGYQTVILGSPVWGERAPMIMSTFIESVDLDGKTVLPLLTFAFGANGIVEAYQRALPGADVRPGIAVKGDEVAEADVMGWLRANQLI